MNNLHLIFPEIFLSLSIMFLLILGVFKKNSFNINHRDSNTNFTFIFIITRVISPLTLNTTNFSLLLIIPIDLPKLSNFN